jgi:hypothetical protein
MLSIMFGQSKYYSDALSENVRRGNRTKLENGWRPNKAPLGYLNDPSKIIVPDPLRFPLVRRMFDLALTGAHSPRQIATVAADDWGLRTPVRRRSGGTRPTLSSIYKILANPFYAGLIHWDGRVYEGRHQPVVTLDEFRRVQQQIGRSGRPKVRKHVFAFTGLIKCTCGLSITAEVKTNAYGSTYAYYHCTRRKAGTVCHQPAVSETSLKRQITDFLRSLVLEPRTERWLVAELTRQQSDEAGLASAKRTSLSKALAESRTQLEELTSLRLRRLLSDEEFVRERGRLQADESRLEGKLSAPEPPQDRIELFREVLAFRKCAAESFLRGQAELQRLILETVGSNFSLKDRKLSIQAAKPFMQPPFSAEILRLCGDGEDNRTFSKMRAYLDELVGPVDDEIIRKIRKSVGQLKELGAEGQQAA